MSRGQPTAAGPDKARGRAGSWRSGMCPRRAARRCRWARSRSGPWPPHPAQAPAGNRALNLAHPETLGACPFSPAAAPFPAAFPPNCPLSSLAKLKLKQGRACFPPDLFCSPVCSSPHSLLPCLPPWLTCQLPPSASVRSAKKPTTWITPKMPRSNTTCGMRAECERRQDSRLRHAHSRAATCARGKSRPWPAGSKSFFADARLPRTKQPSALAYSPWSR